MTNTIHDFAELVQKETLDFYLREYPNTPQATLDQNATVHIRPGKKYTKIDVGTSGKYMVTEAGEIFGIKGYGQIHRGHQWGTLDTIHDWDWSGYAPKNKAVEKAANSEEENR